MSYILDALKRADADRDRQVSAIPDLHAQADAALYRDRSPAVASRGWAIGLGAVAIGAAGIAWLAWRDEPPSAVIAAAPAAATAPVPAPAPAPAPVTTPPPAPVVATPPPPPTSASPSFSNPPVPAAVAPPPGVAAMPAAPAPAPAARPVPSPVPPPPLRALPPPAPAPAAPPRLPTYASLPSTLRSQLPPLSVNASVYSRTRASRMVILNGQVFREGDRPTDGLVVEEIRAKSSVLSFRGTRFELPH